MVDLDWKARMGAQDITAKPPTKVSSDSSPPQPQIFSPRPATASATSAYEQYLRLPELSRLWTPRDFPEWRAEPVLKPALQALEITFRLVSVALSDPRPYSDRREWTRRLESLAGRQIEVLAALCEDDDAAGGAPMAGLAETTGVLSRERSLSSEVWKIPGSTPVVNRTSDASLLPRLAAWERSEAVASKIQFEIECQMRRASFTLGLGEPNLAGKPNLEYDMVCRPAELHALKKTPFDAKDLRNHENNALYTVHQILESWIFAAGQLLRRIGERVDAQRWAAASADCWLLERIWKLLAEVEDIHMLMDPDDFLRLKTQLGISAGSGSDAGFCFGSASLLELTRASKDLRRLVPAVLGVEVDPNGGPRVQEAAMRLFRSHSAVEEGKVHLLQAFQAVEAAVKRFFFGYRQLVAAVMGSLEASGNRAVGIPSSSSSLDALAQVFLEPPYFPSLDAAKTFLGELWQHELGGGNGSRMRR